MSTEDGVRLGWKNKKYKYKFKKEQKNKKNTKKLGGRKNVLNYIIKTTILYRYKGKDLKRIQGGIRYT